MSKAPSRSVGKSSAALADRLAKLPFHKVKVAVTDIDGILRGKYLAKEKFGLRPLVFHVDAGWNSQQAVNNIEKVVEGLGLDLHTEVIDWREMKDLQLAFFKSGVPHLDTPQDHAFGAALYRFAAKHGIKYILNGGNYSTECVREPLEWHYHASDLRQLKDIAWGSGALIVGAPEPQ